MKKAVIMIMVAMLVMALSACGGSSEEATGNSQNAKTAASDLTEAAKASAWTPPQAADPGLSAKHNNPEDDPRMIVQKNWSKDTVAFIDKYNLIGYEGSYYTDYYADENAGYIPMPSDSYKEFFTPPSQNDQSNVLGYIDFEGWFESFQIDSYEIYEIEAERGTFGITMYDGTTFGIHGGGDWVSFRIEDGSKYGRHWSFSQPRDVGKLYATYGEEQFTIYGFEELWVVEQGLIALKNGSTENPW